MMRLEGETLEQSLAREASELTEAIEKKKRCQAILRDRAHWNYYPDTKHFKRNAEVIADLESDLENVKARLQKLRGVQYA